MFVDHTVECLLYADVIPALEKDMADYTKYKYKDVETILFAYLGSLMSFSHDEEKCLHGSISPSNE